MNYISCSVFSYQEIHLRFQDFSNCDLNILAENEASIE